MMKFTRVCLFVYLFVSGFPSHSSIFYLHGNVTITGEGLYILTYARHLSPLSNEGFFSLPHQLWHGAYIYNGHLEVRGPVTLTPITDRLAVQLSLPVFTTLVRRGWYSNIQPSACRARALTDCAIAAAWSGLWSLSCYM